MMRRMLLVLLVCGCTKSGPKESANPPGEPGVKLPSTTPATTPPPVTPQQPTAPKVTVELTGVTLADDCGGTPPIQPPAPASKSTRKADRAQDDVDDSKGKAKSAVKRRCEQTSMQLSVVADAATASEVHVKQVELVDESGATIGTLAASSPTQWSTKGMYQPWDEKVAAGQTLSVSYVLAQPDWSQVKDRWNKTYTLKVTLTVGASDQKIEKTDIHVQQATSLPPNVKT